MVVFDTDRPVRSKPEFETCPDRAAPTGFVRRGDNQATRPAEGVILVAGGGATPLYVKQGVVPGITDLTRDQPKCIDPRTVKVRRKEVADTAAAEIGPVALAFDAPHPIGRLPAIADLTTGGAAGCVMATFRPRQIANRIVQEVPALAGGAAAAVDADIEPRPV